MHLVGRRAFAILRTDSEPRSDTGQEVVNHGGLYNRKLFRLVDETEGSAF
jgi:hypothetical protein